MATISFARSTEKARGRQLRRRVQNDEHAMAEPRSKWRKPGLHVAAVLLGTGLSLLMIPLLMEIFVLGLQVPVLSTFLIFIATRYESWLVAMLLPAAWIA